MPPASQKNETGERQRRQNKSDRPFRKNSQSERGVKCAEPHPAPRRSVIVGEEKEHKRRSQTRREEHIHRRGPSNSRLKINKQ